ncbi:hypothetical protein [Mucilaginibacter sp. HD30]
MRIRSKALYQYLLQAGVLNGPEKAIALAKAEYRRLYKRRWKKQNRPRMEIRFEVTLKQFDELKAKATAAEMRHTTYLKAMALASIGVPPTPDPRLLDVLQSVSMAVIAIERDDPTAHIYSLIIKAENSLLEYLRT